MVSRMVSRSIYNLKLDTIYTYMYDIPFDRSFLQRSNGIRHVMPSTETRPELTAKASMAQPVSQPDVYANGLTTAVESRIANFVRLVNKSLPAVVITNLFILLPLRYRTFRRVRETAQSE
jgi:hypothetical protein